MYLKKTIIPTKHKKTQNKSTNSQNIKPVLLLKQKQKQKQKQSPNSKNNQASQAAPLSPSYSLLLQGPYISYCHTAHISSFATLAIG
jgi:hypothetical protein